MTVANTISPGASLVGAAALLTEMRETLIMIAQRSQKY